MNREEAIGAVAACRGDAAVVMGPGASCGLLYERADAPATIYNMDMGYASAVALGVALARPRRRVLAIEGEGSFYAGSTVLSTIWRLQPANLVVVVLDNGVWGTGDGKEPTATAFGLDLASLCARRRLARRAGPPRPRRKRAHARIGRGTRRRRAAFHRCQDRPQAGPKPWFLVGAAAPASSCARLRGSDADGIEPRCMTATPPTACCARSAGPASWRHRRFIVFFRPP